MDKEQSRIMKNVGRRQVVALGGSAFLYEGLALAQAQGAYPQRAIHVVVPFTPGGSSDILARAVGQELGLAWKQPVVIDNVPGAGGTLASERAARAAADGYTLFMAHTGTLAINPWLYPKLNFDPLKSFAPVAWVARVPNVLVVHPSIPANTLSELIEFAKANPDKLAYGSGGNGSAAHLTMEYLKLQTGIQVLHVPYKGTAPSVNDLLAGQVQLLFTGAPALLPHIKAGKMKALAISSPRRLRLLPDVPTVAESKVTGSANFEADQWYGLVAPAGTPAHIVRALNEQINRSLATESVRARLATEGAEATPTTSSAFGQLIASEKRRWEVVIKAAHVTVD